MQRNSDPTTEATSQYFVAHLGEATPEVEARLLQWAAGCVEHRFVRDDHNCAALYFARAEGRTVRQMQSLLRTLSSKWKQPLGTLEPGWRQLLTMEKLCACVPTTEPASHAAGAMPCGFEEGGSGVSMPCVAPPPCAFLMRLSEGLDRRSGELLAAMRAQTAC